MNENWVTVYSTNQQYLAELAKRMLADNGIEAVILNKRDSSYNDFGYIEVCVNKDHTVKAKLLIKEFEN